MPLKTLRVIGWPCASAPSPRSSVRRNSLVEPGTASQATILAIRRSILLKSSMPMVGAMASKPGAADASVAGADSIGAGASNKASSCLMSTRCIRQLEALFEAPAPIESAPATDASAAPGFEAIAPTIGIEDFSKIDLRIARIVACEAVPGSTKLLRLTLDLGEGADAQGQPITRNVFSGIASAYQPEQLVGKLTVMVANLAARKMKFGVSEGMVLAASAADEKATPGIYVLEPSVGAQPGMRVR